MGSSGYRMFSGLVGPTSATDDGVWPYQDPTKWDGAKSAPVTRGAGDINEPFGKNIAHPRR